MNVDTWESYVEAEFVNGIVKYVIDLDFNVDVTF